MSDVTITQIDMLLIEAFAKHAPNGQVPMWVMAALLDASKQIAANIPAVNCGGPWSNVVEFLPTPD